MGQAKRKAAIRSAQNELIEQVDFARVAAAIRKLATAASGNFGSDCYTHTVLAAEILRRLGVEAAIKIGTAGWRVGSGDCDVILHRQVPGMIPQPGGVAYHAWILIRDHYIFDPTTYQLPEKSRHMDFLDGGNTTVEWAPDYLLAHVSTVSSLKNVIQLHAGLYHYAEDQSLTQLILSTAPEVDEDDVSVVWSLYCNPDIMVFGPNDIGAPGQATNR